MKPLAIDLYAGIGGWAEGLLAEGFQVIGFDIERHRYGEHCYPESVAQAFGIKHHGSGEVWFDTGPASLPSASPRRKAASAQIAKIPLPLARHIGATFKPDALPAP